MLMDTENSKLDGWKESMKTLLGALYGEAYQPYSIPVVPDHLRKWNENAYVPKVVSIGPRYRGRRDLLPMEENKWRCMMSLLKRSHDENASFENCMESILKLDAAVRASYVDEIKLDRYELATIMVLDGCFLLELLISGSVELDTKIPRNQYANPGQELIKNELILGDLTLLENQIPLFILRTLFRQVFKDENVSDTLIDNLSLSLFGFDPNLRVTLSRYPRSFSHFIQTAAHFYTHREKGEMELSNNNINNEYCQHVSISIDAAIPISGKDAIHDGGCVEHLNRCATRLQAAGISIKCVNDNDGTFKFNIRLNRGILEISPLNITQTTEARWLNFIAWEHSSLADKCCIFTSSAILFSDLICCSSDVQLLKEKGVIVNHLKKSNRDLVDFFHSITKGVDRSIMDPIYSKNFHALNTYSGASYATKITILLYHYFYRFLEWIYGLPRYFRQGYRFAITMVTVLTVVQTCYAVLAYHFPNNS